MYVVYVNSGNEMVGAWKIDRAYKTMQEAAERVDLLREIFETKILEERGKLQ